MKILLGAVIALFLTAPAWATTYYLSTSGSDSNNGLTSGAPWLSPNHAVNCGDVIMAAAGSYNPSYFIPSEWGTVTCPAGNNVAWIECATAFTCTITTNIDDMQPGASYWGVQGWVGTTTSGVCFNAEPPTTSASIHHIVFANNIANGCTGGGFSASNNSSASVDYIAYVGNIAYSTASGSGACYSGLNIFQPTNTDTLPGTHMYIAGNFSWGNVNPNLCGGGVPGDGNGVALDTFNAYSYTGQTVVDNNLTMFNGGRGINVLLSYTAQVYFRHNTAAGDSTVDNKYACAEMQVDQSGVVEEFANLAVATTSGACTSYTYSAYQVNQTASYGGTVKVYNNYGYNPAGNNVYTSGTNTGFSAGPNNTFANPTLSNPVEPGAPSCGSYSTTTACMAAVIANFAPTSAAALGYGYQTPSTTSKYDPLFPQWLCNVNLPSGLVTPGCLTASANSGTLGGAKIQ